MLNLLEILEINKNKNNGLLINEQIDLNNSPLLNLFTYLPIMFFLEDFYFYLITI